MHIFGIITYVIILNHYSPCQFSFVDLWSSQHPTFPASKYLELFWVKNQRPQLLEGKVFSESMIFLFNLFFVGYHYFQLISFRTWMFDWRIECLNLIFASLNCKIECLNWRFGFKNNNFEFWREWMCNAICWVRSETTAAGEGEGWSRKEHKIKALGIITRRQCGRGCVFFNQFNLADS